MALIGGVHEQGGGSSGPGDGEVEIAIVIEIGEQGIEGREVEGRIARLKGEGAIAIVEEHAAGLVGGRDEVEVEVAIVVDIAEGARAECATDFNAGTGRDVDEASAIVAPECGRLGGSAVCDEEVEVAIVVVVGELGACLVGVGGVDADASGVGVERAVGG